jgi:hypothetical protein
MKNIFLFMCLVSLVGCTSTKAVYKNYNNLVNLYDGVDQKEAKIIAQRIIISTDEARNYRITAPDIKNDFETDKYLDYWFVIFGHNWLSPISTDPLAKTYTELREAQFVVVVEKRDGSIKFAGIWYPKVANNFDWVFHPFAYRAHDLLAMPPYKKVKIH